jgi:hypothetical protein
MTTVLSHPNRAALLGFLLLVPFIIVNFTVALRLEPLYSTLGSIGFLASPWLPVLLLALFPLALFVTIRPMLRKDNTCGYHRFYPLNIALGALILAAVIFFGNSLGQDLIACDILRIPNCD